MSRQCFLWFAKSWWWKLKQNKVPSCRWKLPKKLVFFVSGLSGKVLLEVPLRAYNFRVMLLLYPSVYWHCWLSSRKGMQPVRDWSGAGMVISLGWGADLRMAQLKPLPLNVSCFSKIQIGFTFLVPAQLDIPGPSPEGHKTCMCACVRACDGVRACVHVDALAWAPCWHSCD